jgi:hypothetical protein
MPERSFEIMAAGVHAVAMQTFPIIAIIDARAAAAGGLRGARIDDPKDRPTRRRTTRPSRP